MKTLKLAGLALTAAAVAGAFLALASPATAQSADQAYVAGYDDGYVAGFDAACESGPIIGVPAIVVQARRHCQPPPYFYENFWQAWEMAQPRCPGRCHRHHWCGTRWRRH